MRTHRTGYWTSIVLCVFLVLALLALLTGCEADNPFSDDSPTRPNVPPSSYFEYTVTLVGTEFVVSFTNQSRNSQGGTENLTYQWEFQGKGTSTSRNPRDRRYTISELGLSRTSPDTTRSVSLLVTENNDVDRTGQWDEVIEFSLDTGLTTF
jgi:hypothetical protein